MQTELDKTISRLSIKLAKEKYAAIKRMTEMVMAEHPGYRKDLVRKAIIYYFFD